jgi:hypothetical protein
LDTGIRDAGRGIEASGCFSDWVDLLSRIPTACGRQETGGISRVAVAICIATISRLRRVVAGSSAAFSRHYCLTGIRMATNFADLVVAVGALRLGAGTNKENHSKYSAAGLVGWKGRHEISFRDAAVGDARAVCTLPIGRGLQRVAPKCES